MPKNINLSPKNLIISICSLLCLVFSFCSKEKESVLETNAETTFNPIEKFGKTHLPLEVFEKLNWKNVKEINSGDTILGWFVYPRALSTNIEESYFVGAIANKPVEIKKYLVKKNFTADPIELTTQTYVNVDHEIIKFDSTTLKTGNNISQLSHPSEPFSTTQPVVVYGKKKEKKKVTYVSVHHLCREFRPAVNPYNINEYIAPYPDGTGGSYGGGIDNPQIINLALFADWVIWNNLYLFTTDEYPGKEVGLDWKWWQNAEDQSFENIDATFFNLQHLRLNRFEALHALANSSLNKTIMSFLQEHNLEIQALISGKITLRHSQFNLLDKPDNIESVNIIHTTNNEFLCCINPVERLLYRAFINWRVAILKQEHPSWSSTKCYLTAHLDLLQAGLDIGGLFPVYGEVCDLTNGVIYTIRGDGINAALSYAGAIPILGWTATGAKWAMITVALANGRMIKLIWKNINGIIDFGNRSQLREVLQITSSSLQAHHVIPWGLQGHKIIQDAAKSKRAFHMNELLNGIPIEAWRNQPNHNVYNNLIKSKLDALPNNLSPNDAYDELVKILEKAKQAIKDNSTKHLNEISF